jgi:hypothetical protein
MGLLARQQMPRQFARRRLRRPRPVRGKLVEQVKIEHHQLFCAIDGREHMVEDLAMRPGVEQELHVGFGQPGGEGGDMNARRQWFDGIPEAERGPGRDEYQQQGSRGAGLPGILLAGHGS